MNKTLRTHLASPNSALAHNPRTFKNTFRTEQTVFAQPSNICRPNWNYTNSPASKTIDHAGPPATPINNISQIRNSIIEVCESLTSTVVPKHRYLGVSGHLSVSTRAKFNYPPPPTGRCRVSLKTRWLHEELFIFVCLSIREYGLFTGSPKFISNIRIPVIR